MRGGRFRDKGGFSGWLVNCCIFTPSCDGDFMDNYNICGWLVKYCIFGWLNIVSLRHPVTEILGTIIIFVVGWLNIVSLRQPVTLLKCIISVLLCLLAETID